MLIKEHFKYPHKYFAPILLNMLSLCSTSTDKNSHVAIPGAGGSFPALVYNEWISNYIPKRRTYIDLHMSYNSTGSSKGLELIQYGNTIVFAGSETLPSNLTTNLKMFPTMAGAVSIAYNIPEVKQSGFPLHLTREQIVGIYNGTYTNWNDSTFTVSNPNVTMPRAKIIVIARYGKSGTTNLFTTALSAFSEEWKKKYGPFSEGIIEKTKKPAKWAENSVTYYGKKNSGMAGIIASFEYSIGYVVIHEAKKYNLDLAMLQNSDGQFISPDDSTAIQKAMDIQSNGSTSLTGDLVRIAARHSYPIIGYTYMIIHMDYSGRCNVAKELLRFIDWFNTDEYAITISFENNMVHVTKKISDQIKNDVLLKMKCNGQSLWEMAEEDKKRESYVKETWIIPVAVTIPIIALLIIALFSYIIYQKLKLMKMINNNEWNIALDDILFYLDDKAYNRKSRMPLFKSVRSLKPLDDIPDGDLILSHILQWPGRWKGHQIGIRLLDLKDFTNLDRKTKSELIWMREHILHSNVVRFYGLTEIDVTDKYVVNEYCSKGMLTDILHDGKFNLTADFKFSLSIDAVSGMSFLHAMGIIHGNLRSRCCVIDTRWTVKIADWEYCRLYSIICPTKNPMLCIREVTEDTTTDSLVFRDFWTAPEILKSEFTKFPTTHSDIYSFAIILLEIFSRDDPYVEYTETMTHEEILNAIMYNHLRPEPIEDIPITIRQIMEIAWTEIVTSRPTFDHILKMLKHANPSRKSVLDSMMEAMEEYTDDLEDRIEERTNELNLAKQGMEQQLSRFIPKTFVSNLFNTQQCEFSNYLNNCILVAELHGFTEFVAEKPMEVVSSVLKQINSLTEKSVSQCQVHQISTETNSWIYLSGLDDTFDELSRVIKIACLALDWQESFRNNRRELQDLQLRAAIHIGSLQVSILDSPKAVYVFGNDLNEAKQMLSSCEPSKIRISKEAKDVLAADETFHIETENKEDSKKPLSSAEPIHWLTSASSKETIQNGNSFVDSGIEIDNTDATCESSNTTEVQLVIQVNDIPLTPTSELALESSNIPMTPYPDSNTTQTNKNDVSKRTHNKIYPV